MTETSSNGKERKNLGGTPKNWRKLRGGRRILEKENQRTSQKIVGERAGKSNDIGVCCGTVEWEKLWQRMQRNLQREVIKREAAEKKKFQLGGRRGRNAEKRARELGKVQTL